jgi:hypothetical protein
MSHSLIVIIFGLNCGPGPSFSSDIWIERFWGVVVTEQSPLHLEFQTSYHHQALDDHALLNCIGEALDSERERERVRDAFLLLPSESDRRDSTKGISSLALCNNH